ncbi:MAG: Virulence factor MviN [candidate division TM6 bacterium GW2011_GWF2_32_72]|nr:MAG: Virulence factor MviN [candidate division TM6 bacterium GW2011_GWF2_32_72]
MSSIKKRTFELGSWTLISRFLGLFREILLVKILGASALSDAFLSAYKLPNTLRKTFAEGAMSISMVPTITKLINSDDKKTAESLMTVAFLFFETLVALICIFGAIYAPQILRLLQPGFSQETIDFATSYLRLLIPMIFFLSSSYLITAALHSVQHFRIPALGPIILNIFYLTGIGLAYLLNRFFNVPMVTAINFICIFLLAGVATQLVIQIHTYFKYGFEFGPITFKAINAFKTVLWMFIPSMIGAGLLELNFVVDTYFASYLPTGSVSLITYANRFMGIPVGVFASSFATILLPSFSKTAVKEPEKFGFLLTEATKLVLWVTIPAMFIFFFFSNQIFATLYVSQKFSVDQALQTSNVFKAFLIGTTVFSLNKILLTIYYSKHKNFVPTIISVFATALNALLNFLLMKSYGAVGLALATTLSQFAETTSLLLILHLIFKISLDIRKVLLFTIKILLQVLTGIILFILAYSALEYAMMLIPTGAWHTFFFHKMGYWFWAGPLSVVFALFILQSRKFFHIDLHFME